MHRFVRAQLIAVFLLLTPSLFAATRTWTGTSSGSWSDPANWGGTLPVAGDDLVFPAGALNPVNTNDFAGGTSFQSLSFADAYSVGGNALTIGAGGITSSAGAVTIALPLQLGAAQSWTNTSGIPAQALTFTGNVDLNGFALTLIGTSVGSRGRIDGAIGGTGQITIAGSGFWQFFGANTYAGQTIISSGILHVPVPNALGFSDNTLANGTIVQSGGRLLVSDTTVPAEYVQLFGNGGGNGALRSDGGFPSTLTGTVELASADTTLFSEIATLRLSGVVTGTGRLGLRGDFIELTNSGNDFAGPVVWEDSATALRLGADNVIPAGKALNVLGSLDLMGHAQTIVSLAGPGNVRLGVGGHLTITGPGSTTFSGGIVNSGTITLTGSELNLTGVSNFTGAFENNGGTLRIIGGTIAAPFTQTSGVFSLANNGTAGAVTITGGTFAPGQQGSGIGNTGNLAVTGASYDERIDGTAAGAFGNIRVTGTVNLTGSTLTLSGTAAGVALGNQFVMIDNDGADPVIGTFAGLPEGASIAGGPGNFTYTISYSGGSGNDVVLTAASAPTATSLTSSSNPSQAGESVTFTATVTPLAGSGTPTGTVTFRDGSTVLGTVALAGGSASFSTSALLPGSHSITAEYSGDATNLASTSAPLQQAVLSAPGIPALDPLHLAALALLLGAIAVVALRQ
ncbi:MAG TPA: Ig-like domain repeat protein [Thermoanaerobaculia bacterium]|nr:Ig-like domain repeat protein [Thermoanaerobaculia bacterium]